jgi:hypothetical protein
MPRISVIIPVFISDGIQAQTYTMFASEKVSERNENCRFQPAYVRKAIAEKSCQVGEIRRGKTAFPDPGLKTAMVRRDRQSRQWV